MTGGASALRIQQFNRLHLFSRCLRLINTRRQLACTAQLIKTISKAAGNTFPMLATVFQAQQHNLVHSIAFGALGSGDKLATHKSSVQGLIDSVLRCAIIVGSIVTTGKDNEYPQLQRHDT